MVVGGAVSAAGRAPLSATLGVGGSGSPLHFYGGGCRCGGGYNQADGPSLSPWIAIYANFAPCSSGEGVALCAMLLLEHTRP